MVNDQKRNAWLRRKNQKKSRQQKNKQRQKPLQQRAAATPRARVCVSDALLPPALFRSIEDSIKFTRSEEDGSLEISGEIALWWYKSQSARAQRLGGEHVTALEILSVQEKPAADYELATLGIFIACPKTKRYTIRARIHEHVAASSAYGAWIRAQRELPIPIEEGLDYSSQDVKFDLFIGVPTKRFLQWMKLSGFPTSSYVPKFENILTIHVPSSEEKLLTDLQIDRLFEFYELMQRRYPFAHGAPAELSPYEKSLIEAKLQEVDEHEQNAVTVLSALLEKVRAAQAAVSRLAESVTKQKGQVAKKREELTAAIEHNSKSKLELQTRKTTLPELFRDEAKRAALAHGENGSFEALRAHAEALQAEMKSVPGALEEVERTLSRLDRDQRLFQKRDCYELVALEAKLGQAKEQLKAEIDATREVSRQLDRCFIQREHLCLQLHLARDSSKLG